MVKAVLFDLDGTLLDRDASLQHFIDAQYHRFKNVLSHIPHDLYKARFVELDARGYVWKDRVYRQLIEEFAITEITWEALLDDYVRQFHSSCLPFPNLIPLFDELQKQNILLGMITNGFTALQSSNLKALGIASYFKVILISEEEGIKKPDPEIFKRALDKLGVHPADSIYVGDHPMNDVQASRQVGMTSVWKKDRHWDSPVQADFIIDDLYELESIVKQLA